MCHLCSASLVWLLLSSDDKFVLHAPRSSGALWKVLQQQQRQQQQQPRPHARLRRTLVAAVDLLVAAVDLLLVLALLAATRRPALNRPHARLRRPLSRRCRLGGGSWGRSPVHACGDVRRFRDR